MFWCMFVNFCVISSLQAQNILVLLIREYKLHFTTFDIIFAPNRKYTALNSSVYKFAIQHNTYESLSDY